MGRWGGAGQAAGRRVLRVPGAEEARGRGRGLGLGLGRSGGWAPRFVDLLVGAEMKCCGVGRPRAAPP